MNRLADLSHLKVALVHDYLNQWGGAEQVLQVLYQLFPKATIFTLFHDERSWREDLSYAGDVLPNVSDIRTSGLQKLPVWLRGKRFLMPIYPTEVEKFDLNEFDLVISDSSAFAKGILTRPGTVHISYCHSPTRYLWDWHAAYLEENNVGIAGKLFVEPMMNILRLWDRWAADRVDYFVANSRHVESRIRKFYGRPSRIIYPPVDVMGQKQYIPTGPVKRQAQPIYDKEPDAEQDFYLIVSRLSAYKRIDLAIKACNRLQLPLVIVGAGREEKRLKSLAWGTVQFKSQLSRRELIDHYRRCKALIMPGEEDFGMVMVEAMSFGKPVIAYRAGGALEIVKPGLNGEFFDLPRTRSLMDTLRQFERQWADHYHPVEIFDSVSQFDQSQFIQQMHRLITEVCGHHLPQPASANEPRILPVAQHQLSYLS